jgi:hypothetical protein
MDRAQPGARGSTNRNIEFGEATTGKIIGGYIVSADDPTLSAQRYSSLDETAFNEFDAAHAAESLTVTVDPGEAFVDGWLARDVATYIDLAADTNDQTVIIGWDPDAIYDDQQHDVRDEADRVIVDLESNVGTTYPTVGVWEFDTDGNGVVEARDLRNVGVAINASAIRQATLAVENPDRLPIAELGDGDSIELAIPVTNGGTLEVYRWGAFDASDGISSPGLVIELLDGNDIVQASANTANKQSKKAPVASYENSSGSESVFKLRARNATGDLISNPGVGCHFGYVVD